MTGNALFTTIAVKQGRRQHHHGPANERQKPLQSRRHSESKLEQS